MQQYEYTSFDWSHGSPNGWFDDRFKGMSLSGALNSMGREGWELVTATSTDPVRSIHKYILKRPV